MTVTVCMYCPQLPQAHSVLLQVVQLNFCHLPDSKAQITNNSVVTNCRLQINISVVVSVSLEQETILILYKTTQKLHYEQET